MTDPHHVEDDSGCLRLVLAVPSSLLALIAAFFCRTALTIHPYGAWDRDAFAGIAVSCLLTIGSTGATVML
ncbi:hypothetical protein OG432_04890 [Streptomyces sp. NBC_00442]|uniref:hypothetical protein n=1 Tax=Streptomyces sp. NBC_00442 TaxID=2903651 RepID=UPI002E1DFF12